VKTVFNSKHGSARASWKIPSNFPDPHIAEAYFNAQVNDSCERFHFGDLHLHRIRKFCKEVLGWTDVQVFSFSFHGTTTDISYLPDGY
jgi:hypothetical protein